MSGNDQIRLHATIDGRVQGVGFRYFVLEAALPLNISGWVRNTAGGQVEVTAEGDRKTLDKFLDSLRRGPRAAFVTEVTQEWLPATGEFSHFDIRGSF
ncbi:MAG TPA: acylphosphatase [Anaerolineaceae bacterium]